MNSITPSNRFCQPRVASHGIYAHNNLTKGSGIGSTPNRRRLPGTLTSSRSCNLPSSVAFFASECDLYAYSSCACLETPNAAASLSAEWPMTSLVENSAIAGSYGEIIQYHSTISRSNKLSVLIIPQALNTGRDSSKPCWRAPVFFRLSLPGQRSSKLSLTTNKCATGRGRKTLIFNSEKISLLIQIISISKL